LETVVVALTGKGLGAGEASSGAGERDGLLPTSVETGTGAGDGDGLLPASGESGTGSGDGDGLLPASGEPGTGAGDGDRDVLLLASAGPCTARGRSR
jgi:hypothetical protein